MSKSSKHTMSSRALKPTEKERIQCHKIRKVNVADIYQISEDSEGEDPAVRAVHKTDLSESDAIEDFRARVFATTGASSYEVGLELLTLATEAVTKTKDTLENCVNRLNSIAKFMQPFEPRDEIEGQLLAQLAVLHQQSMSWLGRAMRTERVDFANTYLNGASKLLTRHHETLATLMKYRRGGEQRVHVEHVHVNAGGKAIVGNVGTGGGLNQKNEEGPHAKV